MAGKIALGLLVAVGLVFFGYSLQRLERIERELCFRVVRVVRETDADQSTLSGMKPPFTILVHEKTIQRILPVSCGNVGDEVWLPDPNYSSFSSN